MKKQHKALPWISLFIQSYFCMASSPKYELTFPPTIEWTANLYPVETCKKFYELLNSAKKGDCESQFKLAECYYNGGHYFPSDNIKAKYWYEQAALIGHPQAQYNLALFYELGLGNIDQDLQKAKYWFQQSIIRGCADAKEKLDGLESKTKRRLSKQESLKEQAEQQRVVVHAIRNKLLNSDKLCNSADRF